MVSVSICFREGKTKSAFLCMFIMKGFFSDHSLHAYSCWSFEFFFGTALAVALCWLQCHIRLMLPLLLQMTEIHCVQCLFYVSPCQRWSEFYEGDFLLRQRLRIPCAGKTLFSFRDCRRRFMRGGTERRSASAFVPLPAYCPMSCVISDNTSV